MFEHVFTLLSILLYVAGFVISMWLVFPLNLPEWAVPILGVFFTGVLGTLMNFIVFSLMFGGGIKRVIGRMKNMRSKNRSDQ
jgi:hypothetical protein